MKSIYRTILTFTLRVTGILKLSAAPLTVIEKVVMAKVIEFYIPKNFWKSLNWAPHLQRGKVIEFCLSTKQSA